MAKDNNNSKSVKNLIKGLKATPYEIGLTLLRERLLAHAENDMKVLVSNPEVFRNPMFGLGMYRDLFQRIITELNFGDTCEDCYGVGYFTDVNEDNHIERCDTCGVFETDQEAEKYHNAPSMKDKIEAIKQSIRDLRDDDAHLCEAHHNDGEGYCSCGNYDAVIDELDELIK